MSKCVVILGAPGAGKGTQAKRIADASGWAHISTGDLLREAVRNGTDLGRKAEGYMKQGALVPDDLIVGIVGKRLEADDCREGFILDGFPRTVAQAEQLDALLVRMGIAVTDVASIDVDEEEIVERLSKRLVCDSCGMMTTSDAKGTGDPCTACSGRFVRRKDDEPETIKHRLNVYKDSTRSLIAYFRGKGLLRPVDGTGTADAVAERLLTALGLAREA